MRDGVRESAAGCSGSTDFTEVTDRLKAGGLFSFQAPPNFLELPHNVERVKPLTTAQAHLR